MTDQKIIDLIVRAGVKGEKSLDTVTKSISDIEKAIDRQSAAAKRGESSLDELKGSLAALKQVQDQLIAQRELITRFEKTADGIKKAEDAAARAAAKLADYKAKLGDVSNATQAQNEKLDTYAKRVERTNAAVSVQIAQRDRLAKALTDAGVALDGLAEADRRNLQTQAQLGLVYQKNSEAIKTYSDDIKTARDAERKAAQERNQAAKEQADRIGVINAQIAAARKKDNDQQAQSQTEYAQKLDIINAKIADAQKRSAEAAKATEAASKRDAGLRQQADEIDRTAQKYTTLARAANTLTPSTVSLRDAINGLLDPGKQARSTIGGLENQVNSMAKSIGTIRGPVQDYKAQIDGLVSAQRALVQQAGLVDAFRRDSEAVRAARTEFSAARADVARLSEEMRKGGDAATSLVKPMAEAQARLKTASGELRSQIITARESQTALRQAGIATNNLAAEQNRLSNTAKTVVTATGQLADAVKKYGQESEKAAKNPLGGLAGDSGRTTLSFIQRIRGEVLALAASFVGLYATINLGKGAIDSALGRETIKNQLSIAVGNDKNKIDEEYAYIKRQSDRIGIEFDKTAKGYAKFAAAASMAGRTRQEIRYIFETFAEVGKVANLSTEDMNGVFKALEQIFSKGKIQAEELRGQLGDRLFGAFQVAASALKDQFPDLNKALEKGQVSADQLLIIAKKYRETVADQLPAATNSLTAAQARFNNTLFDFKTIIADSGFIDSYSKALGKINEYLKTNEGRQFAQSIGEGFKAAADGVIYLMQNLDTVKTVLASIGLYMATAFAVGRVAAIAEIVVQVKSIGAGVMAAVVQVKAFAAAWPILATVVGGVLGSIAAGFAGWQIGKWAYNKFEEVRNAATWAVTSVAEGWAWIRGSFQVVMDGIPVVARNTFNSFINILTTATRKAMGLFASLASAAGLDGVAKALDGLRESLTLGYEDVGDATKRAREQMAKEVANIRQIRAEMLADNQRTVQRGAVDGPQSVRRIDNALAPVETTAMPEFKPKKIIDEAEVKKAATLIETVTHALAEMKAKIEGDSLNTLAQQLKKFDDDYLKLQDDINKVSDKTKRLAFLKQFEEQKGQLRLNLERKYNEQIVNDEESLRKKVEEIEAAGGRKSKGELEARLSAIDTRYAGTYRELEKLREKFVANGRDTTDLDLAKTRIDAGTANLKVLEAERFKKDELNRLEQEMQNLLSERTRNLQTIAAQEDAGLLTSQQANEQRRLYVEDAQPKIEALAATATEFATSLQGAFDPTRLSAFLAQMQLAIASGGMLNKTFQVTGKQINDTLANGAVNAISKSMEAIGGAITKQNSWSDAIRATGVAFLQFAADFMREIALMIIKQQILKALQAGAFGGTVAELVTAAVKHTGGVVGAASGVSRGVSASWFAGAPRYHTGGVAGLAPGEYPAILQKGEEVLTKNSPRNVLNGGLQQGAAKSDQGVRFVLVDDRSKVPEAMSSSEGERVIVQALRRNAATIKQILR